MKYNFIIPILELLASEYEVDSDIQLAEYMKSLDKLVKGKFVNKTIFSLNKRGYAELQRSIKELKEDQEYLKEIKNDKKNNEQ